ncbi:MAG: type I-U CRISPR-associated protein Csx17, partial [Planctomycetaceae bacterium]|nr:type I-U CRISPR-associated protein Csx17 [Planctomycetaceae bacterium]
MNELRHDIELTGCAPTPLAHYLKALGILRLVSEQIDKTAQGWWKNDRFWLRSKLDREGLIQFFLNEYEPTPIVAPWNGGSGFFPKDNRVAIDAIRSGNALRYTNYRTLLARCERILAELHLEEKPDDQKAELLQQCRNFFPDRDLDWLDAAYVLTADGPKYPPLLGTGGNDGRLEFTNNYMQHLVAMVSPDDGTVSPMGQSSLNESLFAEQSNVRNSGTIGQFDPGSLGGANNGTGFEGASTVNSWDFLLMLDGAMTFAAAAVKKLESSQRGVLAYPFCVRSTGVGYGSADRSDEESARSEMWLPLWNAPATFSSVSTLMSEGRAVTGRRQARHGVDFARAIAGLGVDRGVNEFQRIAFQQRNGLAYLAVPLGRFQVKGNPDAEELLAPLDHWLDRFRSAASGKNAPARATRALRQIESAIFRLCERGDTRDVQDLLIALGEAEAAVAISQSLREGDKGSGINPVPLLTPDWVTKANDHSTEFRIAAALASVYDKSVGPMRRHFEPI